MSFHSIMVYLNRNEQVFSIVEDTERNINLVLLKSQMKSHNHLSTQPIHLNICYYFCNYLTLNRQKSVTRGNTCTPPFVTFYSYGSVQLFIHFTDPQKLVIYFKLSCQLYRVQSYTFCYIHTEIWGEKSCKEALKMNKIVSQAVIKFQN